MKLYKEDTLVIELVNNEINEPKIARSVFNKISEVTKRAGFKKDFTPLEIEFIRATSEAINKHYENNDDK